MMMTMTELSSTPYFFYPNIPRILSRFSLQKTSIGANWQVAF